ncbi:MAG: methyltransferase domain-containing protein [Ruminococcaceae bacterium]|nr:methyltransferase domain-containing protein [Oscillospiraceae bacterium]
MQLPEEFKSRMKDLLGEDYDSFISSFEDKAAVRALRVNTLKINKADFAERTSLDLTPLSFSENGFIFNEEKVGADPLHHAGAYYVQDPGAMCTVSAVSHIMRPDMRVLDLCAAPGGKSTQLLEYLTDGYLVSNEIDRKRCRILRSNLERMGAVRATLTNTDSEDIANSFGGIFDLVVCDAPCSGEGMMRKYDEAVTEWSVENVLMCAERQREILANAAECVAPGGYLLYSTCTFSLEENEMTVDKFLTRHEDFKIVPVLESVVASTADGVNFEGHIHGMKECRRFYPHISDGEGQFLCLMKRDGDAAVYIPKQKKKGKEKTADALSKEETAAVEKFFSDNIDNEPHAFIKLGDTVMMTDGLPTHRSCLFAGVAVGSVVKGRLEPHHHLFSALGTSFKRKVELSSSSPEAAAYLSGEVIDTDKKNGWCAVLIDGCSAGGGKIVDGKVKNHYPKGLRLLK